jgi:hypothetical protein
MAVGAVVKGLRSYRAALLPYWWAARKRAPPILVQCANEQ